jgi:RHS repeat-associated protein
MTDGSGTTTYTYDQLDRLTETVDGNGAHVALEYNLDEQPTGITYPNGKAATYSYDNEGREATVTDWLGHTTKFAYDPDAELTSIKFPAETGEQDTYAYNEADAPTAITLAQGSSAPGSLTYTLNKLGLPTKAAVSGLPGEAAPAYGYDKNGRLTKGIGVAYKYDAAGNNEKIGTTAYTYDAADQLKTGTHLTFGYNAVGERTKTIPAAPAQPTSYGYDQAGNLTSLGRGAEGGKAAVADSYGYDGDGLRISETVSGNTAQLSWNLAAQIPLLLDDGQNSYVYGPGGLAVEQISHGGAVQYLHHDQQGSTRMLTSSTGTVTATLTYDGYGNTIASTGTAKSALGYDGQYTSPDTGLIYLRARTYDPATAQFLSRDPLEQGAGTLVHATARQYAAAGIRAAGGSGPYTYANGNPLGGYDPTGLSTIGACVHVEVNFIVHLGASGCVQASTSGEVGATGTVSGGLANGVSAGVTGGSQFSNAEHISELSEDFINTGASGGLVGDFSVEGFAGSGKCDRTVSGGGASAGLGGGTSQWVGGSHTESVSVKVF